MPVSNPVSNNVLKEQDVSIFGNLRPLPSALNSENELEAPDLSSLPGGGNPISVNSALPVGSLELSAAEGASRTVSVAKQSTLPSKEFNLATSLIFGVGLVSSISALISGLVLAGYSIVLLTSLIVAATPASFPIALLGIFVASLAVTALAVVAMKRVVNHIDRKWAEQNNLKEIVAQVGWERLFNAQLLTPDEFKTKFNEYASNKSLIKVYSLHQEAMKFIKTPYELPDISEMKDLPDIAEMKDDWNWISNHSTFTELAQVFDFSWLKDRGIIDNDEFTCLKGLKQHLDKIETCGESNPSESSNLDAADANRLNEIYSNFLEFKREAIFTNWMQTVQIDFEEMQMRLEKMYESVDPI